MFKTLSKEFVAARMAVEAVRDVAEANLIASLAKQRELALQCDQFQAQQAGTKQPPFNSADTITWTVREPAPKNGDYAFVAAPREPAFDRGDALTFTIVGEKHGSFTNTTTGESLAAPSAFIQSTANGDSSDGAGKDAATRDEVLKFVVQTEGVEKLQELASVVSEIGPSEHDQAMELLDLFVPSEGNWDTVDSFLVNAVLGYYKQCRAAVAECNKAD